MEKLELHEIVGYLPYGLKLNTVKNEMYLIDFKNKKIESTFRGHLINIYEWDEIKPILRPLSDLTKFIKINGLNLLAISEIEKEFNSFYFSIGSYCGIIIRDKNPRYSNIIEYQDIIQKLYSWHFDIHNLINRGLAIDINKL